MQVVRIPSIVHGNAGEGTQQHWKERKHRTGFTLIAGPEQTKSSVWRDIALRTHVLVHVTQHLRIKEKKLNSKDETCKTTGVILKGVCCMVTVVMPPRCVLLSACHPKML